MKKLFILLFLLVSFTSFAQSKINGDWKGAVETPNGDFELNFTFKVEGEKLTGVWKSEFGETELQDGKVDGKKFSYTLAFGDMSIQSNGELVNDDEIVIKSDRGEIQLKRMKP